MTPRSEEELSAAIAEASGPLALVGGGTRGFGVEGEQLSLAGLRGVTLYEPGALTLVAAAGTPVSEIESLLEAENQRLAFEPMDHRHLLGTTGTPTIGGVMAANVSGPRRIAVGAARDFLLGVRFVDGQGTVIRNGGRVMKNVTGYDLVKLMAGSFGVLGALSEVSLKVLPRVESAATLQIDGLSDTDAVRAMSRALGSPYEVTGAAHQPGSATWLRIEGFDASVRYRAAKLAALLGEFGAVDILDQAQTEKIWRDIRDVKVFCDMPAVWRVSVKPGDAPALVAALGCPVAVSYDWGGGLIWIAATEEIAREAGAQEGCLAALHHKIQSETARAGGHATLTKGPKTLLRSVLRFQPEKTAVARVSEALRRRFDPRAILNPGLMAPPR